jgi:group I intron endonuclease
LPRKPKRPILCGIYKISNILDDRKYIGSAKSIHRRWTEHKSTLIGNYHDNQKIQNWVNKYSINYLIFEIMETCVEEELLVREQHYLDTIIDWKRDWNICKVAGNTLGVKCSEKVKDLLSIPVAQYDLKGNFMKKWRSASEAGRETKASFSGINDCCRGKALRCIDWQWKYYINDDNIEAYIKPVNIPTIEQREKWRIKKSTMPIAQYTLKGIFIKKWYSKTQISKELSINRANLSEACNLKCASAGRFQWRYYTDESNIEPCYNSFKEVALIDDIGATMKIFNSLAEAGKELGIDSRRIQEVCAGTRQHTKGYKFKYLNNEQNIIKTNH